METYIAFLRGINVSGKNIIRMEDLKKCLNELNLQNIRTYIQSGNIIFNFLKSKNPELKEIIREKILYKFGFNIPVIIRTKDEIHNIISNMPFNNDTNFDISKLSVTFLSKIPHQQDIIKINRIIDIFDKFLVFGTEVYLYCPQGFGKTKFSNNFFEKHLNVEATSRNWRTLNKILDLSK